VEIAGFPGDTDTMIPMPAATIRLIAIQIGATRTMPDLAVGRCAIGDTQRIERSVTVACEKRFTW